MYEKYVSVVVINKITSKGVYFSGKTTEILSFIHNVQDSLCSDVECCLVSDITKYIEYAKLRRCRSFIELSNSLRRINQETN